MFNPIGKVTEVPVFNKLPLAGVSNGTNVYKLPLAGISNNQCLTPLAGFQKYQCLTNSHWQASVMIPVFNNSHWQASVMTNV
ncbi:hypothetical protein SLEP1_g22579 [Rubroshorea leprosula]|uniref:Uncharacterized protein n=1 Tax=Rubroshorea leprosula TaxID=152421 RepID=A0AAV5JGY2_9ROSI|nr:hypothetical protein SLEP1_g22579 [Rubroshorea leprosula]